MFRRKSYSLKLVQVFYLLLILIAYSHTTYALPKDSPRPLAQKIISQWAKALGGRARLAQINRIYRQEDSNEDGLVGKKTEWITNHLQYQETVDHTKDQSLTIFNGKMAWTRDWNGQVLQLQHDDIKMTVAKAIIHSFAPLIGQAGQGEYLGKDPEGKLFMLKFQPTQSFPLIYYIDTATYLPTKVDILTADGADTTNFSQWQEVEGLKIPFVETQGDSESSTKLEVKTISFNYKEPITFNRPEAGPQDSFFLSSDPVQIPFNFENKHLMVLGKINGHEPRWLLIDTGAGYSIINDVRLTEFGLTSYGGLKTEGGGNSTSGSYVADVTYQIGGVELRNQHAVVLPLQGLEKIYGMPIAGLLGYDFISRFVMEIDYTTKLITLYDPSKYSYKGKGDIVPFYLQGNEPHLNASVTAKGKKIATHFILDSGAADTVNLTAPFVREHNLLELIGGKDRQVNKLAGSEKEFFAQANVRGLMDEVKLGNNTFSQVPLNLSVNAAGVYASAALSGTIGETILSRFSKVVIDYAHNQLILEPNSETFGAFSQRSTFGLTLLAELPDLKTFRITAVAENSPAQKAGFKKDDIITAVDSIPTNELTLGKLREVLTQDTTKQLFTIRRGTEETKITAIIEAPLSSH